MAGIQHQPGTDNPEITWIKQPPGGRMAKMYLSNLLRNWTVFYFIHQPAFVRLMG